MDIKGRPPIVKGSSRDHGSCMGCNRHLQPYPAGMLEHEVFVIGDRTPVRLCRLCLAELVEQAGPGLVGRAQAQRVAQVAAEFDRLQGQLQALKNEVVQALPLAGPRRPGGGR